jgi:very-short-patch-repair endonuclease
MDGEGGRSVPPIGGERRGVVGGVGVGDEGKGFARRLRREATLAEREAWEILRDRRFHGLKFRRQQPVGPFVVDFYCPSLRLAIELDGPIHNDPEVASQDNDRTNYLTSQDIQVLRLSNTAISQSTLEAQLQKVGVPFPLSIHGEGARG